MQYLRNIAIIAHINHDKNSGVGCMLCFIQQFSEDLKDLRPYL